MTRRLKGAESPSGQDLNDAAAGREFYAVVQRGSVPGGIAWLDKNRYLDATGVITAAIDLAVVLQNGKVADMLVALLHISGYNDDLMEDSMRTRVQNICIRAEANGIPEIAQKLRDVCVMISGPE